MPQCTLPGSSSLLKQIIHFSAQNPINTWPLMSAGLTNILNSWPTPLESTRSLSLMSSVALHSFPLVLSCFTAVFHQQICPLLGFPLFSSQMIPCSSLPVDCPLIHTLDLVLCLFSHPQDSVPVVILFHSRISGLSQSINNSEALPP